MSEDARELADNYLWARKLMRHSGGGRQDKGSWTRDTRWISA